MKKKIIVGIIVVALALIGIMLVKNKQKEIASLPKAQPQPVSVRTAQAEKGALEMLSRQIGEVQPSIKTDVAARITGYILTFSKREGDNVNKGETLATLDDRELADRAAVSEAEISGGRQKLTGAKSAYETQRSVTERDQKLFNMGGISKEALERSRSTLENVKSSMNALAASVKGLEKNASAAKLQTDYARVKAPFSGIITRRYMEPGDLAVPGKAILALEQTEPVKVVVQIPQELMGKVRQGARVYLVNADKRLAVSVTRVYPALGKNLMGGVEIVLAKSPFGLPSGSTVTVDLVTGNMKGTLIPENALVHTDKGHFVFLVENGGKIRVKTVSFLGSNQGKAVISDELPQGAHLATGQENRLMTLTNGTFVTTAGGRE
ncbi:MAG: efflux RND transporter periplasmic adaptor subunit [Desulfobacteraceae bacterium]|jgi:RND family efflux transporter MFP subunit